MNTLKKTVHASAAVGLRVPQRSAQCVVMNIKVQKGPVIAVVNKSHVPGHGMRSVRT